MLQTVRIIAVEPGGRFKFDSIPAGGMLLLALALAFLQL